MQGVARLQGGGAFGPLPLFFSPVPPGPGGARASEGQVLLQNFRFRGIIRHYIYDLEDIAYV